MPYIGKSPEFGVRNRFVYQATAGQTSFSGSDGRCSKTLTYTDSLYMDVYQNGVLTQTRYRLYSYDRYNSRVGHRGISLNDVVEMVVYDAFCCSETATQSHRQIHAIPFKGNNSIIRLNGQTISSRHYD
jgi:hypothetical protein